MKKSIRGIGLGAMMSVMAILGSGCVYGDAITLSGKDKQVVSKTYAVKQFDELDVATGLKVVYTVGDTRDIKVTGPAYMVERLEIKQKGRELSLKLKSNNSVSFSQMLRKQMTGGVKIEVSSPSLKEIDVSSGASVVAATLPNVYELEVSASSGAGVEIGSLVAEKFEADASSGAGITVKQAKVNKGSADASSGASVKVLGIEAVNFEADASSGAGIRLEGTARNVELEANSGASVDAKDLKADMAKVDSSSGGSIKYNARSTRVDKQDMKNYYKD